jgi:hypothetical protein
LQVGSGKGLALVLKCWTGVTAPVWGRLVLLPGLSDQALDPDFVAAHNNLASAVYILGYFDEAIAKFARVANTFSYGPVHQPHNKSVARWRSDEKHLGALIVALGEACDPSSGTA